MTKSYSMAGWRVAFLVGNAEIVAALGKLKSYLDYGTFQPVQIAATVTLNEEPDYPKLARDIYQSRRNVLCEGLSRIGWEVTPPQGTMFVWAPIPEPYKDLGSLEVGKLADLQVLDRNPLTDIHNTNSVKYVMKNGRLYDGNTLDEMWPRVKPLPAQWWWTEDPPAKK